MTESLTAPLDEFKERELEILALMAEGLSNREIGERLFIATQTVRWYTKHIYSKLGTSRRVEAVTLARSMGLIDDPAEPDETQPDTLIHHKPPLTTGPFIGREPDLDALADLLAQPDLRLVSIIAAGGMGKSRLSLELAHRMVDTFERGAAFIDLTTIQSPDEIATTALAQLGIGLDSNQPPRDQLLDYCREKNLLLVFDNMEHVLDGAPLLADLLQAAPGLKIVATSRERLNLRLETTYYLHPVDGIENARTLFLEVAAMMHPSVAVDEAHLPQVDRLAQLVGGMPLALTLAATWVDMLSVREIADEIAASLDFLTAEWGDVPERQHSIRAVVDPSWQRLSDDEKGAFTRVAVFQGGFNRETFQAVTGASLRVLQTLLSRSLVMHGHNRRYQVHPLLRQYAHDKLSADDLAQARATHLAAFRDYAEAALGAMHSGDYMGALERLDSEQDNFRAALDWALEDRRAVEDGTHLALALSHFWNIRSHAFEAAHYLQQALDHDLPDALRAPVLAWRSRFHLRLGMTEQAQDDVHHALALAEALDDKETIALSLIQQVNSQSSQDVPLAERAVAASEVSGNPILIAHSLNSLANGYYRLGDDPQALSYYERALAIYEDLGDLHGVSMAVYNIGLVQERLNNPVQSRDLYERSLAIKRQIGDRAGAARRLSVLAQNYLMDEEFDEAAVFIEESCTICEEIGDRMRLSHALLMSCCLGFITADFEHTRLTLERGLALAQQVKAVPRQIEYHQLLAVVLMNQGKIDDAETHVMAGLELAQSLALPYNLWLSLLGYAQFIWKREQHADAVRIATVIYRLRELGSAFDRRYVLEPLVYRIKNHIGAEAWEAAEVATAELTLEAQFAAVTAQLG